MCPLCHAMCPCRACLLAQWGGGTAPVLCTNSRASATRRWLWFIPPFLTPPAPSPFSRAFPPAPGSQPPLTWREFPIRTAPPLRASVIPVRDVKVLVVFLAILDLNRTEPREWQSTTGWTVSPKFMTKAQPPVPQNVTYLGRSSLK